MSSPDNLWIGWYFLGLAFLLWIAFLIRSFAGPVFFLDLVRTSRRGRFPLLRSGYALLLLLVLFAVYTRWFGLDLIGGLAGILEERRIPSNEQARFATTFFHGFLIVQFLVMLFLTPALTAGAIAEEREKGTLGDLLTTDLSASEIIFGKLLSRLANLVLLLLAGVPVLAIMQVLGGVDPALLVASFTLTLCTTVSMASLSLAYSARASRTREAIFIATTGVITYQVLTGICCASCFELSRLPILPPFFGETIASGSVIAAYRVLEQLSAHGTLGSHLPMLIVQYVLCHGIITAMCLRLATRALRETPTTIREKAAQEDSSDVKDRVLKRPPLAEGSPLIWKEIHVEPGSLDEMGGRELNQMLTIFGFCYGLAFLFAGVVALMGPDRQSFVETGSLLADVFLPLFAVLGLLRLALRSASCFSSEFERRTIDSLLTTDLTNEEILRDKWLGCLGNLKGLGVLCLFFTFCGVLMDYISVVGFVLVLLASFAFTSFVVFLGMTCSLTSRTTYRATVATILALLGVTVGHWLLYLIGSAVAEVLGWPELRQLLVTFHLHGLTPPVTLGTLASSGQIWVADDVAWERLLAACAGTLVYALMALGLWCRLQLRFPAITGRLR